jgi:hypothetical protein
MALSGIGGKSLRGVHGLGLQLQQVGFASSEFGGTFGGTYFAGAL